jgi:D-3-phosphoglycerate dehydrogenase / 2-oxoglutarate reductase
MPQSRIKVAVTDHTFESLDPEKAILEPLGYQLVVGQCRRPEELTDLVGDADAVITQFAPVNAAVIGTMRQARVIARYGIGVDNVDLDAARARGIPVCNVPGFCTDEVADHTLALILALTRQVVTHCQQVRGGGWGGVVPLEAMVTLKHLTVGILGFGRIGREVAARLRGFKCALVGHDPVVPAAEFEQAGVAAVDLEGLLRRSDVLALHCPSNAATRRLINQAALAKMKRGALLINGARGDVVDTAALIEALRSGHLGGAGLDVCDPEPLPVDNPLRRMANVIITPHVAAASVPAVSNMRTIVAQTVARALRGEPLHNIVNGVKP